MLPASQKCPSGQMHSLGCLGSACAIREAQDVLGLCRTPALHIGRVIQPCLEAPELIPALSLRTFLEGAQLSPVAS